MSEDKYKNRYRISSARAAWHDYMGGAYFVTICTKDREFFFGKIENDEMHLSEIGRYANEQFCDVSSNYPYAIIPSYVVMPNHIHAIVIIDDHYDACRDAIYRVSNSIHRVSETICVPESEMQMRTTQDRGGITGRDNPMLYQSLGTVIRGLKARVTHYAKEKGLDFAWQSRFHDRIIRDQDDMNEAALYVDNNVAKWPEDEMHP